MCKLPISFEVLHQTVKYKSNFDWYLYYKTSAGNPVIISVSEGELIFALQVELSIIVLLKLT